MASFALAIFWLLLHRSPTSVATGTGSGGYEDAVQPILKIKSNQDVISFLRLVHHRVPLKIEPVFCPFRMIFSGVIPSHSGQMGANPSTHRENGFELRPIFAEHVFKCCHPIELMLVRAFGMSLHRNKRFDTGWLKNNRPCRHYFFLR